MAQTGARVQGLRHAVRALERYGVETRDLKAAFQRISRRVVSTAESRVPRGATGRPAASIRPSNAKNKSVVRAGGAAVVYAGPRHYGWPARNITAAPFLSSAADDHAQDSIREMEKELRQLARRYNVL